VDNQRLFLCIIYHHNSPIIYGYAQVSPGGKSAETRSFSGNQASLLLRNNLNLCDSRVKRLVDRLPQAAFPGDLALR
jgi:hypothetical protein